MWSAQIEALAQRYEVIRCDLRGCGRSSLPTPTTYRHCDDLRALLDQLGIDEACIGGQSLGGGIAIDTALAHPDMVRGLILAPALPVPGWRWVEGFPPARALKLARREGVEAAKQAFLDLPMNKSAMEISEAAASLRSMVTDYSGWHLTNRDPGLFAAPDAIDRLNEIAAPALVVVGGRDVVDSLLTAERLAAELPGAEHHVIDHVGHYPNLEDATVFNLLALRFLDGLH